MKNYPDPAEMLDTYGADALRLYLLNSPAMKAEEMRMTEEGIKQSLRDVIIPLWNAYSFFVTYAAIDGWTPSESRAQTLDHRLDRWILSELQTLLRDLNAEMEAYRLYRTVPAMVAFIEKLTNWYIRRSRRRFWKSEDDQDKQAAYDTLYRGANDLHQSPRAGLALYHRDYLPKLGASRGCRPHPKASTCATCPKPTSTCATRP